MKATPTPPVDPLQGLKDIHLPPTPSWWPPAPGWWLIAALLLLLAGLGLRFILRKRQQNRALRLALKELEEIRPFSRIGAGAAEKRQLLEELSALLRRFCLAQWPQAEIAALHGEQWLDFLLEKLPPAERPELKNNLALLLQLYAPDRELEKQTIDPVALKESVRKCLRKMDRDGIR